MPRRIMVWVTAYILPLFLSGWFGVTGAVVATSTPPFPYPWFWPWMFWIGAALIVLSVTNPFDKIIGAITGTVIATVGLITSLAIVTSIRAGQLGDYGPVWLGAWLLVVIIGWLWPRIAVAVGLHHEVRKGRG